MSASLALQGAIYGRLTTTPAVTALVPAANIIDAPASATLMPCVQVGSAIELADDLTFDRRHVRVSVDLHAFVREHGTTNAKAIAGALYVALRDWTPDLGTGLVCVDFRYDGARFMRDAADPTISHAVISFDALIGMET